MTMGISKDILKLHYIKNQKLLKKHHMLDIMSSTHISDNELHIVSIKNSHDSILKAKDQQHAEITNKITSYVENNNGLSLKENHVPHLPALLCKWKYQSH